jgi:hypothetical protein
MFIRNYMETVMRNVKFNMKFLIVVTNFDRYNIEIVFGKC